MAPKSAVFTAVHPEWEDRITIHKDGRFERVGYPEDRGQWAVSGCKLTLNWEKWEPEALTTKDAGRSFTGIRGFWLKWKVRPFWWDAVFRTEQMPLDVPGVAVTVGAKAREVRAGEKADVEKKRTEPKVGGASQSLSDKESAGAAAANLVDERTADLLVEMKTQVNTFTALQKEDNRTNEAEEQKNLEEEKKEEVQVEDQLRFKVEEDARLMAKKEAGFRAEENEKKARFEDFRLKEQQEAKLETKQSQALQNEAAQQEGAMAACHLVTSSLPIEGSPVSGVRRVEVAGPEEAGILVPDSGWVSLEHNGKHVVLPFDEDAEAVATLEAEAVGNPWSTPTLEKKNEDDLAPASQKTMPDGWLASEDASQRPSDEEAEMAAAAELFAYTHLEYKTVGAPEKVQEKTIEAEEQKNLEEEEKDDAQAEEQIRANAEEGARLMTEEETSFGTEGNVVSVLLSAPASAMQKMSASQMIMDGGQGAAASEEASRRPSEEGSAGVGAAKMFDTETAALQNLEQKALEAEEQKKLEEVKKEKGQTEDQLSPRAEADARLPAAEEARFRADDNELNARLEDVRLKAEEESAGAAAATIVDEKTADLLVQMKTRVRTVAVLQNVEERTGEAEEQKNLEEEKKGTQVEDQLKFKAEEDARLMAEGEEGLRAEGNEEKAILEDVRLKEQEEAKLEAKQSQALQKEEAQQKAAVSASTFVVFKVLNPEWTDKVIIDQAGWFERVVSSERGHWEARGSKLTLNWNKGKPQSLTTKDLGRSFSGSRGFALQSESRPSWWRGLFQTKQKLLDVPGVAATVGAKADVGKTEPKVGTKQSQVLQKKEAQQKGAMKVQKAFMNPDLHGLSWKVTMPVTCFVVVQNNIALRKHPSLKSSMCGMGTKGEKFVGSVYQVGGSEWLKLNIKQCLSIFKMPDTWDAWTLIDGSPMGLENLLEAVEDVPKAEEEAKLKTAAQLVRSKAEEKADIAKLVAQLRLVTPFLPIQGSPVSGAWHMWTVVGGLQQGGILARNGKEFNSKACNVRLAPGTVLAELELAGNRLHFQKVHGDGPDSGWVSLEHNGKPLVLPFDEQTEAEAAVDILRSAPAAAQEKKKQNDSASSSRMTMAGGQGSSASEKGSRRPSEEEAAHVTAMKRVDKNQAAEPVVKSKTEVKTVVGFQKVEEMQAFEVEEQKRLQAEKKMNVPAEDQSRLKAEKDAPLIADQEARLRTKEDEGEATCRAKEVIVVKAEKESVNRKPLVLPFDEEAEAVETSEAEAAGMPWSAPISAAQKNENQNDSAPNSQLTMAFGQGWPASKEASRRPSEEETAAAAAVKMVDNKTAGSFFLQRHALLPSAVTYASMNAEAHESSSQSGEAEVLVHLKTEVKTAAALKKDDEKTSEAEDQKNLEEESKEHMQVEDQLRPNAEEVVGLTAEGETRFGTEGNIVSVPWSAPSLAMHKKNKQNNSSSASQVTIAGGQGSPASEEARQRPSEEESACVASAKIVDEIAADSLVQMKAKVKTAAALQKGEGKTSEAEEQRNLEEESKEERQVEDQLRFKAEEDARLMAEEEAEFRGEETKEKSRLEDLKEQEEKQLESKQSQVLQKEEAQQKGVTSVHEAAILDLSVTSYEAVQDRIAIRRNPSFEGRICGMGMKGAKFVGRVHQVGESEWLRLIVKQCQIFFMLPGTLDAWVLIDGPSPSLLKTNYDVGKAQEEVKLEAEQLVGLKAEEKAKLGLKVDIAELIAQCRLIIRSLPIRGSPVSGAWHKWVVVGGREQGGILVRSGKQFNSTACNVRLAQGTVLEELELVGKRLHFEKVHGDGPDSGWVSLERNGKLLVLPVDDEPETDAVDMALSAPTSATQEKENQHDSASASQMTMARGQGSSASEKASRRPSEEEAAHITAMARVDKNQATEPLVQRKAEVRTVVSIEPVAQMKPFEKLFPTRLQAEKMNVQAEHQSSLTAEKHALLTADQEARIRTKENEGEARVRAQEGVQMKAEKDASTYCVDSTHFGKKTQYLSMDATNILRGACVNAHCDCDCWELANFSNIWWGDLKDSEVLDQRPDHIVEVCGKCGCPPSKHENLQPWLHAIRNHMRRFRSTGINTKRALPSKSSLPIEARSWTLDSLALYALTSGRLNPSRYLAPRSLKQQEGQGPLISVCVPTNTKRHCFHRLLYKNFKQQDYKNKELVVIDTGSWPSTFLKSCAMSDESVRYFYFPVEDAKEEQIKSFGRQFFSTRSIQQVDSWSLGLKRNCAVHLSRGAIICHFDDDDLYAQDYVSFMFEKLIQEISDQKGAHLAELAKRGEYPAIATLSEWHMLDLNSMKFRWLNPKTEPMPEKWRKPMIYGYGFSYVFTRASWELEAFPDTEMREDDIFMEKLRARKVPAVLVRLPPDRSALVAHCYHMDCTSGGEFDGNKRQGYIVRTPVAFEDLLPLTRSIAKNLPWPSKSMIQMRPGVFHGP